MDTTNFFFFFYKISKCQKDFFFFNKKKDPNQNQHIVYKIWKTIIPPPPKKKQKSKKEKKLVGGNFVIHQQQAQSCLFSFHLRETSLVWAQVENAWAPPKNFLSPPLYQTMHKLNFSHLFSIHSIPSPKREAIHHALFRVVWMYKWITLKGKMYLMRPPSHSIGPT